MVRAILLVLFLLQTGCLYHWYFPEVFFVHTRGIRVGWECSHKRHPPVVWNSFMKANLSYKREGSHFSTVFVTLQYCSDFCLFFQQKQAESNPIYTILLVLRGNSQKKEVELYFYRYLL